jgi:hypothetical protein
VGVACFLLVLVNGLVHAHTRTDAGADLFPSS